MEIEEEQPDQTSEIIKSGQEQTGEMTAPDSENAGEYSDAHVASESKPDNNNIDNPETAGHEAHDVQTAGQETYDIQTAGLESHDIQTAGIEAHVVQTGFVFNNKTSASYEAMETDVGLIDGEDGEILEDGEIASDQEGELRDDEDEDESKSKSSPTKSKGSHHDDDKEHKKGKRKERHSKRRRSKEDSHRDKQSKKKRHREYVDYDKTDDYEQNWSGGEKKDKNDKKGNRSPSYHSPSHDSHAEDRGKGDKDHRRGSGDRHHSGAGRGRDKHRGRDRDHDSDRKGKDKSPKDRYDKRDKSDRKDKERQNRNSRESKERDNYESPPGIYDSPSDEEANDNRFGGLKAGTLMSMVEGEYVDPLINPSENAMMNGPVFPRNNKKKQKRKEWSEKKQLQRDMEEEKPQPQKKKPLLQTPMEERPQCRFFKEGKCQKGSECQFNHGFRPAKRLEVCKYYVQSTCWSQGECVFMHEEFPCKYFHTGSTCYQGDNCKFSHATLTDETREALDNALAERGDQEEMMEHERIEKKYKKKGLLGDPPQLSEDELHRKLENMKKIPSIFDIDTFGPGESPRKPPGQSPSSVRPQGFYQDNMSPRQGGPGPNMNFQGNRPPFMPGPGGPGMDGPPPGMQGPPPMGGPPFMGPPGMGGPGPGMQGNPLGPPPMNNQISPAAALVGAILRAAPMLQQYRGPAPQGGPPSSVAQGPPTSMSNNIVPRLVQSNMVPDKNMGPQIMSPNQSDNYQDFELSSQNMSQSKSGTASRDPRKGASQSATAAIEDVAMDTDMRDLGDVDMRGQGHDLGDVDLRQDVDMRQEDTGKKGDTTPQQEWDEDKSNDKVENENVPVDIPEHLPPKQREMFLRIRQMSMKIKKDQSAKNNSSNQNAKVTAEDDKWYSSDEDDEPKRDNSSSFSSASQPDIKQEQGIFTNNSMASSMNIMQMINAVKSKPSSFSAQPRTQDTRNQFIEQMSAQSPPQEPTIIHSRDGDCPWRLCRVLYVKQKIPTNIDLNDQKYKADPRVQKMLKMHELEFGKIIDHSKISVKVESPPTKEVKVPDLLDPKVFKQLPKPELAALADPRSSKKENSDPRIKQEPVPINKPLDPRVQKQGGMHNLPVRPMDPRLARQDSNSNNSSAIKSGPRPLDPRLSRQSSISGSPTTFTANIPPLSSTPPLDPRLISRQSSSDPRLSKSDTMPKEIQSSSSRLSDPRLSLVADSDFGPPSVQRQFSSPSTREERDVASSDNNKPKIDYRNDPRFKRKHISESNLSPTSAGKRFPEQRKVTTEYSSPLGGESSQMEDSGYNNYNRQRATKQLPQQNLQKLNEIVPMPSEAISTHDILDSLQIMAPPVLEKQDKNLKDIFKTIDPTASPFC